MLICSLFLVVRFALSDQDLKRLVASSTVVMTGFIFLLSQSTNSQLALLVCTFHAAYKSALFAISGSLIASLTKADDSTVSSPVDGIKILAIPVSFSLAMPSSYYAAAKHGFGNSSQSTAHELLSSFSLQFGVIILWLFAFKLFSSSFFRAVTFGFPSLVLVLMVSWFFLINFFIPIGSSTSASSGFSVLIAAILLVSVSKNYYLHPNVGVISFSSVIENVFLFRYSLVSATLKLASSVSKVTAQEVSLALIAVGTLFFSFS